MSEDGLVSMLGAPPGEEERAPTLALRGLNPRDGTRPVLRLKPAHGTWARGVALASAINQACSAIAVRHRTDDDPAPPDRCRAMVRDPPGKDDVSPSVIEIDAPRLGTAPDHLVLLELEHGVSWADGNALAARIADLVASLDLLPARAR